MRAGRLGGQVDVSAMANVADQGERGVGDRMQMRDQLHQLMKVLNERERNILLSHFGVGDRQMPATFEQMSRRMGLTSQRVRQIEQSALAKLREIAVHSEN
jgi:RNA polymerase nonessential primary-like sigma factor